MLKKSFIFCSLKTKLQLPYQWVLVGLLLKKTKECILEGRRKRKDKVFLPAFLRLNLPSGFNSF